MNVTEEIVNKLGLIGYPKDICTVLKYFLNENIKELFGKTRMNVNDVDFTLADNTIDIESIYSNGHHIISVDCDNTNNVTTIKCHKIVHDKIAECFTITESPSTIENNVISDNSNKKYTYDKINVCFSFEISHVINNELVLDYRGSLSPMYAKSKNFDWFSYNRDYPPKEKTTSFLKKVLYELSGRGDNRKIATSHYATIDLDAFPDSIFGTLINDARMILMNKNSNEKRKIRIQL